MSNSPSLMDKIRKNPSHFYDTPHDVIRDRNLTPEKQNEILKSWEDDTKALLRAESENMPASEKQSNPAELLSAISKLRAELKDKK